MVKVTRSKMQKGDRAAGVSYALYRVPSLYFPHIFLEPLRIRPRIAEQYVHFYFKNLTHL